MFANCTPPWPLVTDSHSFFIFFYFICIYQVFSLSVNLEQGYVSFNGLSRIIKKGLHFFPRRSATSVQGLCRVLQLIHLSCNTRHSLRTGVVLWLGKGRSRPFFLIPVNPFKNSMMEKSTKLLLLFFVCSFLVRMQWTLRSYHVLEKRWQNCS